VDIHVAWKYTVCYEGKDTSNLITGVNKHPENRWTISLNNN